MTENEIQKQVLEILSPYVKHKECLENPTSDMNILQDLGVNSSRLVDVIIKLEDQFDIEISDEDAERVASIGDAVALVQEKSSISA